MLLLLQAVLWLLNLWQSIERLIINMINIIHIEIRYSKGSRKICAGGRVDTSVSFMCMLCRTLICPFGLFLLVIVLSVLLRFTDSDYPFGIFKLFLVKQFYYMFLWHFIDNVHRKNNITNIPLKTVSQQLHVHSFRLTGCLFGTHIFE